jgi:hypothetical protein
MFRSTTMNMFSVGSKKVNHALKSSTDASHFGCPESMMIIVFWEII